MYQQNEFLIIGMLLGLLLGATEIGFRRGCAVRCQIENSAKSHYWSLQAGAMGLLALLLAFTFSMAASRYEMRKQLLTDETNAIGSLYLLFTHAPGAKPERCRKTVRQIRSVPLARIRFGAQRGGGRGGKPPLC